NKLQVILTPQKETKAVTVLVLIGVGSRYETKNIAGISHFIEHMMFKGTEKRPNTLILSQELDKVGAEFNAYTSKDHTGYWIKVNAEYLDLALDMLSDMIFNSKLESEEIEREKGTIIEEINMYEDAPMKYSDILLEEIIFKNNVLAKCEGGTKKSVCATTRKKMLDYKNKHYFLKNMVISVAGNFKENKIKKLIIKYFGENNNKNILKTNFTKFQSKQTKSQIKIKYKKTEQVHLAFGFLGPSYIDKDFITTNILSVILGGSMSSRLFINIRERHGLCYYISSGLSTYQDTGNLMIRAGLDKNRIKKAIELILNELRKIKNKGITKEELNKAKEYIKGKMILNLEDSSSVAEWYGGQQLLIGKTKTPEQKIQEIMKVTKKDVDRVAKKMFQTKNINLALIGPFKDKNKFLKLLKI
ncbi:insulinase family protein, partial [Candidatus Parcubacteria bacterium]|nr:insulinase family protein [Patescibacteria group bacterium]MCG2687144.1 insulinase family protein [Candidatus Parcubacteria bacterium]